MRQGDFLWMASEPWSRMMNADVTTTNGPIRGEARNGVVVFRGIRYATPPIGALRFKPPARPEPWTERSDCTRFGPIAPQAGTPFAKPGADGPRQSEDCLFLNVFTRACDDVRRPVLFWLHGGAYTIGSGSSDGYDGTRFAANHDVVVVTINYRLGALGFTHLAELGEQYASSGNAGLLDQVLALEWVRDNVAALGGDPGNVTVFGESAGAGSAACLMAAPRAAGLFHKAILESGAAGPGEALLYRTLDVAGNTTRRLCQELGCRPKELVTAPIEKLLAAQQVAAQRQLGESLPFGPVVDHEVLPPPFDRIAAGSASSVPTIIGTNLNEARLFALIDPSWQEIGRDSLIQRMQPLFGDRTAGAIDTYRSARPGAADGDIWAAVLTDRLYRVPAARTAEQQSKHAPTFMYLFAWPTPVMGGRLGACHGLEIPFVFNLVDRESIFIPPATPAMEKLSSAIHAAWAAFARTGNPNHDALPRWPAYETPDRPTMVFDEAPAVQADPYGQELALWPAE